MAGKVDIISAALVRLGEETINDLAGVEGEREDVIAALALYDTEYESALTMSEWSFARRFNIGLSRLTTLPEMDADDIATSDYQYAFQIPADCAEVRAVNPRGIDYRIIQRYLLTNAADVQIDYKFKPEESALPGYFVKLFELRLSLSLAIPVTGSTELRSSIKEDIFGNAKYPGAKQEATKADKQQEPNRAMRSSPLFDARQEGAR